MAKVNVVLNCQIDNGKDKKLPGETVSMDEKEALKLADKGMVTFPAREEKPAKTPAKQAKGQAKNTTDAGDDLDPDALDQGGEGDGDDDENGEGR